MKMSWGEVLLNRFVDACLDTFPSVDSVALRRIFVELFEKISSNHSSFLEKLLIDPVLQKWFIRAVRYFLMQYFDDLQDLARSLAILNAPTMSSMTSFSEFELIAVKLESFVNKLVKFIEKIFIQ